VRHIRVNLAFIIDAINDREIELFYCGTDDQVADIGTSQRTHKAFARHCATILGRGSV